MLHRPEATGIHHQAPGERYSRRKVYLGAATIGLWLFAVSTLAVPLNPHQLQIDDTGKVLPKFRQHRAKTGDKISWVRQTGSAGSWFVRFTSDSPCAEGREFGDRRILVCTVSAVCNKADEPACKSYHYRSATERGGQMNDPEIIVEPLR
jgi:hypothetical protein